jgi:hypothetical protein
MQLFSHTLSGSLRACSVELWSQTVPKGQ